MSTNQAINSFSRSLASTLIVSIVTAALTAATVTLSISRNEEAKGAVAGTNQGGMEMLTPHVRTPPIIEPEAYPSGHTALSAPEVDGIIRSMSAEYQECVRSLARQDRLAHDGEPTQAPNGIVLTPLTTAKLDDMRHRCRLASPMHR